MAYSFILNNSLFCQLVIFILHSYGSTSCIEKERFALLQIKHQFNSFSSPSSHHHLLSSWDRNGEKNCCQWEGVTCNSFTSHVTELSLSMLLDPDFECLIQDSPIKPWSLNMTVFRDLEELKSLDLSNNCIGALNEDEALCKLRNLQVLSMGYNRINGRIPTCIGNLTFLQQLDLAENQFTGLVPPELCKLRRLEDIYLLGNKLNGSLPSCIGNMRSLQYLALTENDFSGIIPPGLCELERLTSLYLNWNTFNGHIPRCIGNLTSLQEFDISNNQFVGSIPSSISNLTSLERLDMSENFFEGKFSLSALANLANLAHLDISYVTIEIEIPSPWTPTFQLQDIALSGCRITEFPKFLSHQYLLSVIVLSNNGLVGPFPTSSLHNKSQLWHLDLSNNSLTGSLMFSNDHIISFPRLRILDLSANMFSGKLPKNLGSVFSSLNKLVLSRNHFEGQIPSSITEMKGIDELDLSQNNFSGEVPRQLFEGCNNLELLSLSKNNFYGQVIPKSMNLPQLQYLYLDNNHFHGAIGDALLRSSILITIDISNNELSGEIPNWMGTFKKLVLLSAARNKLHGQIPSAICDLSSLSYLDLSINKFSGKIPSCTGTLSRLKFLHLRNNNLTGDIPQELSVNSNLVALDVRNNHLVGGIPLWIDRLSNLTILQLGNNMLQGELPIQLCHLRQINILDVSSNGVSGTIPACLKDLSFGTSISIHNEIESQDNLELITKDRYLYYVGQSIYQMSELDLSSNQLSGQIPLDLGALKGLHSLNLSHNSLFGLVPKTFSKMVEIESLDLSYNNLSGVIPSELVDLNFLAIFNVSYNNLSGRVPTTGQFADFDIYNYEGNPFLCGFVKGERCGPGETPTAPSGEESRKEEEGDTQFDWGVFIWSFGASCFTFFLTIVLVLYITPQLCNNAWFIFFHIQVLWWFRRRL